MFFRKFKKTHPVKIDVSFDEMIADPDYVRQTAMNFEGDVIKFYTQDRIKKFRYGIPKGTETGGQG